MSSIVTSLVGSAGGAGGTGFAAPTSAAIQNPTTVDQANAQYQNAQQALQQQQQFLQAVQAQNGLQNQSQVFGQLQGVANGTGPNPAQAQLAQSTGANVAQQAALMAGQRGAAANPGMIARQAAMQGANIQQQAAGQAATMQANQSLQAMGQMAGIAGQQAGQQAQATSAYTGATQGEQGQILGGIAAQNNANVGMQSNVNSANAGLAGQRMGQQANLIGNMTGGIGSALGLAKGGVVPSTRKMYATGDLVEAADAPVGQPLADSPWQQSQPASPVAAPAAPQAPSIPQPGTKAGPQSRAGQYHNPDQVQQKPLEGMSAAGNTIGKGIGTLAKAGFNALFGKGQTPQQATAAMDKNFDASSQQYANMYGAPGANGGAGTDREAAFNEAMGQSNASGNQLKTPEAIDAGVANAGAGYNAQPQDATGGQAEDNPNMLAAAKGGLVPAMVSPGEKYLSPKAVAAVKQGADPMAVGKKVPGKPKVKGAKNSYANDTVSATLEEGGIVLPRSVTQSKNPHWEAKKFVEGIMRKQALKKGSK